MPYSPEEVALRLKEFIKAVETEAFRGPAIQDCRASIADPIKEQLLMAWERRVGKLAPDECIELARLIEKMSVGLRFDS